MTIELQDLVTVLASNHGIRTKKTRPSWPFKHQLHTRRTLGQHAPEFFLAAKYHAGIVPWWNHHVINPREAESQIWEIEMLAEEFGNLNLNFKAHSNGTNITALIIRKLGERGILTNRALFTGSALHSDVERSGVMNLIEKGYLQQAIAYVSAADGVVKRLDEWPGRYGSLGAKGFNVEGVYVGQRTDDPEEFLHERLATRVFHNYEHSDYYNLYPEQTFDLANRDLRLIPPTELEDAA